MLNNLAEGRINYVGGIVIAANGTWYYNDNEEYAYQPGSTDRWKLMQDMFDVLMDGDSLNTAILHSISPSDRSPVSSLCIPSSCPVVTSINMRPGDGRMGGCILVTIHSK